MHAVTLLALWYTVYGNINKTGTLPRQRLEMMNFHYQRVSVTMLQKGTYKTGKKCHGMQLSCIDRINNFSPILIVVSNRCEFHLQVVPINIHM